MKRILALTFSLAVVTVTGYTLIAQPPEREMRTQPGPSGNRQSGRRGQNGPPGGMPPWRLGKVIPPPVLQQLDLTDEQQQELCALEKEIRERVLKMLTSEQRTKLQKFESQGPRGPGRNGRGQPPGDEGSDRPERPQPPDGQPPMGPDLSDTRVEANRPGIQWYSTLDAGLVEAKRSGRPIMLVSAAPHCAGVPGVW